MVVLRARRLVLLGRSALLLRAENVRRRTLLGRPVLIVLAWAWHVGTLGRVVPGAQRESRRLILHRSKLFVVVSVGGRVKVLSATNGRTVIELQTHVEGGALNDLAGDVVLASAWGGLGLVECWPSG